MEEDGLPALNGAEAYTLGVLSGAYFPEGAGEWVAV